jgi:Protein of unknown function (DUF1425)
MKRLTLLAGLLTAACVLPACDAIDKPPYAVKPDNVSEARYPQIATGGNLGNHLSYAKPIVRAEPGNPMSVTVPIRLRDNKPVNAQYRFTFLAADGGPVGGAGGMQDWRFMVLPPRLQVFMEGLADSPDAVNWRLEIRPAQ